MEKTLSILTAIYNIEEPFLRGCIESLIADKSEDIEIILGDDCSENGANKVCAEYVRRDGRIKYIRPDKNGGVSVMRNLMIDAAKGKYVTFVDGDDIVSPFYVQKLLTAAKGGFDIIMFERESFFDKLPAVKDKKSGVRLLPNTACREFSASCLSGAPYRAQHYGIKDSFPSSVCTKVYRQEFLRKNNLKFVPGLKKSQDTVFNTRAYFYCESLGYLGEKLYYYRKNPASVCNRCSVDFENMIRASFMQDEKNLNELFGGDEKIRHDLYTYKLIFNIIENCRLNIFHKDNPLSRKKRRASLKAFAESEPYKSFFESFDISSYGWHERRLVLKLVKNRRFNTLNLLYKHPFLFKVYGRLQNLKK